MCVQEIEVVDLYVYVCGLISSTYEDALVQCIVAISFLLPFFVILSVLFLFLLLLSL